jgi:hypothetical protein
MQRSLLLRVALVGASILLSVGCKDEEDNGGSDGGPTESTDGGDTSSAGEGADTTESGSTTTEIPGCEPPELGRVAAGEGGFVVDGGQEGESSGWSVSAGGDINRSGHSVSGAGDVNDDGHADIAVGAARVRDGIGNGRVYLVFGKSDTETVLLSDVANGHGGVAFDAEAEGDELGSTVSGGVDVNRDGRDDIIAGALGFAPNGITQAGRTYVVFGGDFSCPDE